MLLLETHFTYHIMFVLLFCNILNYTIDHFRLLRRTSYTAQMTNAIDDVFCQWWGFPVGWDKLVLGVSHRLWTASEIGMVNGILIFGFFQVFIGFNWKWGFWCIPTPDDCLQASWQGFSLTVILTEGF